MANQDSSVVGQCFGHRPLVELILIAERICESGGEIAVDVDDRNAAKELIAVLENPYRESRRYRDLAAGAITVLATRNRSVRLLLIDAALAYGRAQQEIGDATPYSPNSIDVLSGCPACDEVVNALRLMASQPGMAQADAHRALSTIGATE